MGRRVHVQVAIENDLNQCSEGSSILDQANHGGMPRQTRVPGLLHPVRNRGEHPATRNPNARKCF